MRTAIFSCVLALVLPCRAMDSRPLLWEQPGNIGISEWIWGPGGEVRAPKPPFEFLAEGMGGTNAKIRVLDGKGDRWTVKFGSENHSEVFAARLLFATGYNAQPNYFVRKGVIIGVHDLKRAKPFIGKHGEFVYARFKLHKAKRVTHVQGLEWSWTENPFVGTHELNGLKILMMLMSNWDGKDSRDGIGSNTVVYSAATAKGDRLYYSFDDWGATFGRWGGFFSRDKWNADGYSEQTPNFARSDDGQTIRWGYRGKHSNDITSGIRMSDVRWLLTYLSPITDEQLRAGLQASGATRSQIDIYTRSIRERISQLQRLCDRAGSTSLRR